MMRGFKDAATSANTNVTGGQTVYNPWIMIGGVGTSVCKPEDIILPENAKPGDVLVLTKPLGTQMAALAHEWMRTDPGKWDKIKNAITENEVRRAYKSAVDSMCRLNITAAKLMHKHNAHGATDVTGFGLFGHAKNLARSQKQEVTFKIHTLPIIAHVSAVCKAFGNDGTLHKGGQPETSGGLLISFKPEDALKFIEDMEAVDGYPAWIVGSVESGERTAVISPDIQIIEVLAT
jgi:selenide,water dikinase